MKYAPPIGSTDPNAGYVDRTGNIPGSPVPAAAVEPGMREIVHCIQEAGLTPDGADLTQLAQAIALMIQRGSVMSLVHSVTAAGTTNWTVPDIFGNGRPWSGQIRLKGSGGGGGGSQLSGMYVGGLGGGEGCLVERYMTFIPGTAHTLTVGAGGPAGVAGNYNATFGNTSSFGTITSAPGGQGMRGGTKSFSTEERVTPGAPGGIYTMTPSAVATPYQTPGGHGGGSGGGSPGAAGAYGGGGGGGMRITASLVDAPGFPGGHGFIEIYLLGTKP